MLAGVERTVARGHAASSTLLRLSTEGVYRVNDADAGPMVLTVKGASKATTPRTVSVYARHVDGDWDGSASAASAGSCSCVLLHAPMLNLTQSFSLTLPVFTRFVEVVFNGHISPGCALPRHEAHIALHHHGNGGPTAASPPPPSQHPGVAVGASWSPSPVSLRNTTTAAMPSDRDTGSPPAVLEGVATSLVGEFRDAAAPTRPSFSRNQYSSPPPTAFHHRTTPQRRAVPRPPPVTTPLPPPSLPWDARAATTPFGSSNRDPQGMWVVAGDGKPNPALQRAAYGPSPGSVPRTLGGPWTAPTPLGHDVRSSDRAASAEIHEFTAAASPQRARGPDEALAALRREVALLEAQAVALETRAVEEEVAASLPAPQRRRSSASAISRDDVAAAVTAALASERQEHEACMAAIAAESLRLVRRLRRYPLQTPLVAPA